MPSDFDGAITPLSPSERWWKGRSPTARTNMVERRPCFCCKEVEPIPLGRRVCDWCLDECTNEGCTRPEPEPPTDCEDICMTECQGPCGV